MARTVKPEQKQQRRRWATYLISDKPAVRSEPARNHDLVTHYAADGSVVKFEVRWRSESKRVYRPDELYMSLKDAGARVGMHPATLRRAATKGTLQTRRFGNQWLTTPQWLHDYQQNRRPAGRPRKTA